MGHFGVELGQLPLTAEAIPSFLRQLVQFDLRKPPFVGLTGSFFLSGCLTNSCSYWCRTLVGGGRARVKVEGSEDRIELPE